MRAEPHHGLGKVQGRLEVLRQREEGQGVPTSACLGAHTFSSLGQHDRRQEAQMSVLLDAKA